MPESTVFPDKASRSSALYEEAKHVMPGGNTRTTVFLKPYPIYAERGEGCRVWDVDGVERFDCINNFTAAIHGHAHPVLMREAIDQIRLGTAFGMPTASEIDMARLLAGRIDSVEQVRFSNSGTEAVMMALKAARAHTSRPAIAKCEGAYHGSYDFAEVSMDSSAANWGNSAPRSVPYTKGTPQGVLDEVVVIPFNDVDGSAEILRARGQDLAAILVDPMPNRAGLMPATPEYLAMLREVADEIGALLIFDEVISFRLGHGGTQGLWGVEADITCLGKIIGGGFPVGATGGRAEVMQVFDPSAGKPAVPQGGTFSANPMTMRCGLAAMELLDQAAFAHLDRLGDRARDGIGRAFRDAGIAGQTTGRGSLLKFHFTDAPITSYRSAQPDAAANAMLARFNIELLNRGVLMAGYGLMAFSTPMTDDDIDAVVAAVSASLKALSD